MTHNRNYKRTDRVSDQIQKEMAQLIQREMSDPRIGMTTVSGVDVSRDFSTATIFVTVLGKDEDSAKESVKILNQASSYLRTLLANKIKLRVTPKLTFKYDKSVLHGNYLSSLIDKAVSGENNNDSNG